MHRPVQHAKIYYYNGTYNAVVMMLRNHLPFLSSPPLEDLKPNYFSVSIHATIWFNANPTKHKLQMYEPLVDWLFDRE